MFSCADQLLGMLATLFLPGAADDFMAMVFLHKALQHKGNSLMNYWGKSLPLNMVGVSKQVVVWRLRGCTLHRLYMAISSCSCFTIVRLCCCVVYYGSIATYAFSFCIALTTHQCYIILCLIHFYAYYLLNDATAIYVGGFFTPGVVTHAWMNVR